MGTVSPSALTASAMAIGLPAVGALMAWISRDFGLSTPSVVAFGAAGAVALAWALRHRSIAILVLCAALWQQGIMMTLLFTGLAGSDSPADPYVQVPWVFAVQVIYFAAIVGPALLAHYVTDRLIGVKHEAASRRGKA